MRKYRLFLLALSLFAASSVAAAHVKAEPECVNVFFDRGPDGYWMGKTCATMLQNFNLQEWTDRNTKPVRPEPNYREN